MATLMAAGVASKIGAVVSVIGTVVSAAGAIQAGNAQQAAAEYEAKQLEQKATTERALSQRRAEEERRQKELVQSRARAIGAASGGGIDIELAGDLEKEGEYRALTALWEGEEAARGRTNQATALRFEGKAARRAGYMKAGKTVLDGASSLFQKYS